MLTIKNLTISVGEKTILKEIDFTFEKGKIYAVMGPNGSGKSTLAQTIMGYPAYSLSVKSVIGFQGKKIGERANRLLAAFARSRAFYRHPRHSNYFQYYSLFGP